MNWRFRGFIERGRRRHPVGGYDARREELLRRPLWGDGLAGTVIAPLSPLYSGAGGVVDCARRPLLLV